MILAKSDGTSLIQHISDCLIIWEQLRKALPLLPKSSGLDRYWELLFVAIYFHDLGKAQAEFQKVLLKEKNLWFHQRHELYSLPFIDKLNMAETEKTLLKKCILAHHKDFDYLRKKKKDAQLLKFELKNDPQLAGHNYHPEDFTRNLSYGFSLHLEALKVVLQKFQESARRFSFSTGGALQTIHLADYQNPIDLIVKSHKEISVDSVEFLQNLLLWGGLKICDHYGSAGIKQIYELSSDHFHFLDKMEKDLANQGKHFYTHQRQCFQTRDHCLLLAPTGSGKTESAMGWLRNQLAIQGRAFYVLPYTASINAMHKRLANAMDPTNKELSNYVGIQHGNVPPYLSALLEDIKRISDPITRNKMIKSIKENLSKMLYPLKIVTPFQLLKYFYGVKGFEMGITQLAGAKIIFDEIHAYDPITFAQILVMLKFLVRRLSCKIMIMTATLPNFMMRELQAVLNIKKPILADQGYMRSFVRHQVSVLEGSVHDHLSIMMEKAKQKRTIIVCNTVQQAQLVYSQFVEHSGLPKDSIVLLHSRFNGEDRMKKEALVKSDSTQVLIGTQAIEVSLDIDYDIMYTEPAPLDALLQRFGRVNRKAAKPPSPVNVLMQGGEYDDRIYDSQLVKNTLRVLKDVDILDESKVQELLDKVYPDWLPVQKTEVENTRNLFEESLSALQPYSRPKEREEEFYEQFTGIQVLPASIFEQYSRALEQYDYVAADSMMVGIHRGMYFKLKNEGKIDKKVIDILRADDEVERQVVLVAKCRYNSEFGLTDEFEEIEDSPFL